MERMKWKVTPSHPALGRRCFDTEKAAIQTHCPERDAGFLTVRTTDRLGTWAVWASGLQT